MIQTSKLKLITFGFFYALIIVGLSPLSQAIPTIEQPDRNISVYLLLPGQIGLQGFDPVSYFEEGGGQPSLGLSNISADYGGVTYYFSSNENKSLFLASPTKYEPTYGGWCAWAMANDSFAEIDPLLYTLTKSANGAVLVSDQKDSAARRSHFFISRGAKARFDSDLNKYENLADKNWLSDSKAGEKPRL